MSEQLGRRECASCHQHVLEGAMGYGPWCELYFGERGVACLPKSIVAFQWLHEQGRFYDASLLREWIERRFGAEAVAML